MARTQARRLLRRPIAPRLGVLRLEDRTAPALFTVGAAQTLNGLNNSGCVRTADFDGDGKLDLVITNYSGGTLTLAMGNGDGTFSASRALSVGSGQNVSFVDIGDVNGDGRPDLVCGSLSSSNQAGFITTFLNTGLTGIVVFGTKLGQVSSAGSQTSWVGLAQLTADTNLDLIVCNIGAGANGQLSAQSNVSLFKGDGAGGFSLLNTYTPPLSDAFIPTSAAIADFNGDGKLDAAFSSPGVNTSGQGDPNLEGTVTAYLGDGAGGLTFVGPTNSGGKFPLNLQTADLNADGRPDLIAANAGDYNNSFSETSVGVMLGAGGGVFSSATPYTVGVIGAGVFATAVADFDQDGRPDIAAVAIGGPVSDPFNPPTGKVAVFLNGGGGTFTAEAGSPYTTTGLVGGQFLTAGDYDGKNTPDLAVVGVGNRLVVLTNTSVAPAATTTKLVSFSNPSAYGAGVTFSATVSSAAGTPTGAVTFFDGTSAVSGAVTVDGSGVALFNTSTLSVGGHPITAKYAGVSGFAASVSGVVTQNVFAASTLTDLKASATTVVAGNPVTFTATVSSGTGTPTGSVTFFDGAVQLGSPVPLLTTPGGQQAAFTTSTLAVGPHTITAAYGATVNFAGSTSNSVSVTITNPVPPPVTPTVGLGSSLNPSAFSQAVTFTATVTAASGTPTGSVTFFDGATQLGGPVTLTGTPASAAFTTSTLAVGTHSITASYSGAAGFNPTSSGPLSQVVNPVGTSTALASDLTPATVTQTVTFTATVSATGGVPGLQGAVQFFDGGTAISGLQTIGAGNTATFSTGVLTVGSHTITAGFVPTGTNFSASTSSPLTQAVQKAGLGIAVSSGGPAFVSQPVTLTATITELPVIGPDPGGVITFRLNGNSIGTASINGGSATLITSSLPVGANVITATYVGDTNFTAAASAGYTQQIDKGGVTVALTGGGPATVGLPVSFLATVAESPALAQDPSGTVTFKLNGTTLGTASLTNGSATFTTTALPVGTGAITAEYAGDANFAGGTAGPLSQQVLPVGTSVALGTSSTPATVSQAVALTATVSAALGSPAGTVQFFSGGTAISGPIPVAGGKASFSTAALPVGTTSLTAQFFPADPSFAGSTSPPLTQQVVKAAPGLTVTVDGAAAGQPSAVRAAVTRPTGVAVEPGGTVTFKVNGAVVGTAPVIGGLASITFTLPPGSNTVTAEFGGDGNYTTGAVSTTATVGGSGGQKPGLVGYKEYGVGAGAGRAGDARFFNPDGTERFTAAGLFGGTGGVRVTSADFNADGVADLVAGTGPGGASHVVVLDGKTRAQLFTIDPFESSFVGGVYVSTGDVTGDGVPDLVISPDEGGGPRVRVFSGKGFGQVEDFFGIDDPNFRGGARSSVSDLNGDGVGDLVVAAGFGGGPRVTITSGADRLRGQERVIANFFAGDSANRGGVRLVARDLDGDNKADLVVGSGTGAGNRVTAYSGKTLAAGGTDELYHFDAFPGFDGGVYVG